MHNYITATVAEDKPRIALVGQPTFGGDPHAGLNQGGFDPVKLGYFLL